MIGQNLSLATLLKMGQQNQPEDFAPILLLDSSSEDSSPIIFYNDIDLNDSSNQLPVIQKVASSGGTGPSSFI